MVDGSDPAIVVTGLYRSGTTLVEKCLDQHPKIAMASQPLPLLWSTLKSEFLADLGWDDRLPLGHLFRERRYTHGDLVAWLAARTISRDDLRRTQELQRGYDGWWTPELDGHLPDLGPGTAADIAVRAARAAAAIRGRTTPVVGLKEILVEELLDHFAGAGVVTVVVVRDPVAVVRSLFRGSGQEIMGAPRPTLFHVRQWRRSVAMALRVAGRPGRLVVRHEDVVRDPSGALADVAAAVGVEPSSLPRDLTNLRDQSGRAWGGNSSFEGDPPDPDPALTDYVNLLTGPEQVALGLRRSWRIPTTAELGQFEEPVAITRDDVDPRLSTRPDELTAEVERLALLAEDIVDEERDRTWLLGAHAALRSRAGDPVR